MVGISAPSACCVIFGSSSDILSHLEISENSDNILLLDTKYYSISVKIVISEFCEISESLPVNAVIINGSLDEAKSVKNFESFKQADVRIFCANNPTKEMFDWTIENQVEIVDLIEEPERVREALESSVWPGARMKSDWSSNHLLTSSPSPPAENNRPVDPTINAFDDDFADILEMDDQLEMAQLFNMVGRARSQGANMSDEERRRNAERVICAISKMLGDDLDLDP